MLKKFLSIIGGVFLILLLVVASLLGYASSEKRSLDVSSKDYVEKNVPAIISTWSKDELLKRSSSELRKVLEEKPEQTDLLFQKFSQLGPLESFGEVKGGSFVNYSIQNGRVATATYVATAKFEKGQGQITTRLVQSPSGQWQLSLLNINSPFFLQ